MWWDILPSLLSVNKSMLSLVPRLSTWRYPQPAAVDRRDRQTDGRTPGRYIDPASDIMRAASKIYRWVCRWINFENRPGFGTAIAKNTAALFFLEPRYVTAFTTNREILPKGYCFKRSFSSSAYDTIRYDTRCYFNVRSKADISQLNLPHGTDN